MIEKGKISPMQLAFLMYPTIIATAAMVVPNITIKEAGPDMWISPILSSFVGLLTVYIAIRLHERYPKLTIVEYSRTIFGAYVGKAVSFVFLFFYLHINALVVREYGEFVVGIFLKSTPIVVVMICLVIVCAYAVHEGIEVIGRAALVFVPIATCLIFVMIVVTIPDMHPKHMLPILENGLIPPFRGAIVPAAWFSEFLLIAFLLPYTSNPDRKLKWSFISVASVAVTLLAINFSTLFLFGSLDNYLSFPFLTAVRRISFANFFEHMESLLMAIWVMGIFVKVAVIYYAVVVGTAQWLKLSDYRPVIMPIGFLTILFSIWISPNMQNMQRFLITSGAVYMLTLQVALPALLLLSASLKGGGKPWK